MPTSPAIAPLPAMPTSIFLVSASAAIEAPITPAARGQLGHDRDLGEALRRWFPASSPR